MGALTDNLNDLRSQLKTQLELVTDIGIVHDHPRSVADWDEFFKLFSYQDANGRKWAIRAWTIQRASTSDERENFGSGSSWTRPQNFLIKGYHSIEDVPEVKNYSSALLFENLQEEVCDKLAIWAQDSTKGRKLFASLPVLTIADEREVGNHVVHYCEISITARTRLVLVSGNWQVRQ